MIKRQLDLGGSSGEAVTPGKRRSRRTATTPSVATPRASNTDKAKKAALGFCAGVYPTKTAAAEAFDIARQNLAHWIKLYSQRDPKELQLLYKDADCSAMLAPVAPVMSPAMEKPARKKLKTGDDGHAERFKDAYKWAGDRRRKLPKSGAKRVTDYAIAKQAETKFALVTFHHTNVARAANNPGLSPAKPGPEPSFPRRYSKKLVGLIQEARAEKFATCPQMVIIMAENMIKGTPAAEKFPDGLDLVWLNNWLDSPEASELSGKCKQRPLELDRDRWTTSYNIGRSYDISVSNPEYKPDKPFDINNPEDPETIEILHNK